MRFASFCRNCFIQEDITQVKNQLFEISVSGVSPQKKKSPRIPPRKIPVTVTPGLSHGFHVGLLGKSAGCLSTAMEPQV